MARSNVTLFAVFFHVLTVCVLLATCFDYKCDVFILGDDTLNKLVIFYATFDFPSLHLMHTILFSLHSQVFANYAPYKNMFLELWYQNYHTSFEALRKHRCWEQLNYLSKKCLIYKTALNIILLRLECLC